MIEIAKLLKARGLRSKVLREEYLDHYSSQYEGLKRDGIPHDNAIEIIQDEITKMDIHKAHQAYFDLHFKKPILMTSTFLVLLSFLISIPNNSEAPLAEHTCSEEMDFMAVNVSYDEPPSINPVKKHNLRVYSGFGMRLHPVLKTKKFHKGVDIIADIGTPIIAPSDGIVVEVGFDKKKGNYIEIKHDEIYSTRYFHLSKISVYTDQEIKIGSKIGEIGNTGASSSPHLHYEVIKAGKNVDPIDYLKV